MMSEQKQYFYGLDIGMGIESTVMAEGHIDADGLLVIDKFIQTGICLRSSMQSTRL